MQSGAGRDEARERFSELGLSYSDIREADIALLAWMLDRKLKDAVKKNPEAISTMHMSKKVTVKTNRNGSIVKAFVFVNSHYFTQREAISFNEHGYIGFCGWASDANAAPIVEAFNEWCDCVKRGWSAPIKWVMENVGALEPEYDEVPTCSICGSFNVGTYCADCGVLLYDEREGE